ncbi:MAG: cupredoxin domain-containing protein [Pseudobacteriovorax sp.]|nr:cupredoxin domain-containing protein [Pseudobacteriovorax sp.]
MKRKSVLISSLLLSSFVSLTAMGASSIEFTNKLVGDKKTWVPATDNIKLKKGDVVKVTLVNKLEGAHGFFIQGMTDPILVPGKVKGGAVPTMTFSMKVTDKPGTYEFKCHMHPAHVGGKFTVQ